MKNPKKFSICSATSCPSMLTILHSHMNQVVESRVETRRTLNEYLGVTTRPRR